MFKLFLVLPILSASFTQFYGKLTILTEQVNKIFKQSEGEGEDLSSGIS